MQRIIYQIVVADSLPVQQEQTRLTVMTVRYLSLELGRQVAMSAQFLLLSREKEREQKIAKLLKYLHLVQIARLLIQTNMWTELGTLTTISGRQWGRLH